MMIILTSEQAAVIAGETNPGHALQPIALPDGVTWVLPVEILSDPAHAAFHEVLNLLPQRVIEEHEWVIPEE